MGRTGTKEVMISEDASESMSESFSSSSEEEEEEADDISVSWSSCDFLLRSSKTPRPRFYGEG